MNALLRLADVRHGYDGREVLAGVNLGVDAGECVALLGENGSGKSTLLRVATGRETARAGRVTLRGRTVDEDDREIRTAVAAVLDSGVNYPDLTVREHLTLVALAHGRGDDAADTVDAVLDAHLLTPRADALPHQLSSGQTQLLALAQAFVRPAKLLVLDEPEQRLDTDGRRRLAGRLLAAKQNGAGLLLATHSRELAEAVADTVHTLTGDGLLACGTAGD